MDKQEFKKIQEHLNYFDRLNYVALCDTCPEDKEKMSTNDIINSADDLYYWALEAKSIIEALMNKNNDSYIIL